MTANEKMRAWYEIIPDAPLYMREFSFFTLERWQAEGHIRAADAGEDYDGYLRGIFSFDAPAEHHIGGLGGCTAPFLPPFEVSVLEDRGDYELVRDEAGRHVLYFKNRRNGFMPEYVDHPVKDAESFKRECLWRLSPENRGPQARAEASAAVAASGEGKFIVQYMVGGYMYLRSLIGPVALLYKFYDDPGLIHACMRAWFDVADAFTTLVQKDVGYDKVMLDEDICYNHGSLISPDMFNEFLFPYYKQLTGNIRKRQNKPFVLELDTDGFHDDVIDLYLPLGLSSLAPFEAASLCDPVQTAQKYPQLRICGAMDKRVLAGDRDGIDRMLERIIPPLKARGGFIPTCDHGVPEEVSFENYIYFRNRLAEYAR